MTLRDTVRVQKGGARARSVEATGMPKGIARGTPPNKHQPHAGNADAWSGRLSIVVLCCAFPSNDYQSFDRKQWYDTTFPWSIQAAKWLYAKIRGSVTVKRLVPSGDAKTS